MRNVVRYGIVVWVGLFFAISQANSQPRTDAGNSLMDFQVSVVTKDGKQKVDGTPIKVRRNDLITVVIAGRITNKKYHTYPVTEKPKSKNAITFGNVKGIYLNDGVRETPDLKELPKDKEGSRIHEAPFTWEQSVFVAENADPGLIKLPVTMDGQVCDEFRCFQFKVDRQLEFDVSPEKPSSFDTSKLKLHSSLPGAPVGIVASPRLAEKKHDQRETIYGLINSSQDAYSETMENFSSPGSGKIINEKIVNANPASDLFAFILAGIFWGAISLVTPCVFPMIPITVSIFLKQSEKEHHKPILMASVYSGTIVVVLTLAAAFMLEVFRFLSVNPIMNYGLGFLFIFFALSLFGMYDIELPSGLARFTSAHESKGGIMGTMFMALTFTIISFACVAPFLGGFGGTAAGTERPMWVNLLGGLAFSATFAAPFFFLALFPTLLRKLPKSGSWLNSVKVVMGFLELAAAVKFCRSAELVLTRGEPWLITFDFGMGVYVALCFFAGLYLLGLFRLPHDSPEEHLSVPRMVFAGVFVSLGLYLAPALMKNPDGDNIRPRGTIYSWVESFLLPDAVDSPNDEPHTPRLDFAITKSLEQYRKEMAKDLPKEEKDKIQPQRIFVDFTGINCVNCRINEKSVFSKRYVRDLMEPYLIVKLYSDLVPLQYYSPSMRTSLTLQRQKADAAANLDFERKIFNNEQLPLYAILEPQKDGTVKVLAVYDEGRINNETAFADFLRDPK